MNASEAREFLAKTQELMDIINQLPDEYVDAVNEARLDAMDTIIADGGPGSGHWGHLGILGHKGGSLKGSGGKDFRGKIMKTGKTKGKEYHSTAKKKVKQINNATKKIKKATTPEAKNAAKAAKAKLQSKWAEKYNKMHTPNGVLRHKGVINPKTGKPYGAAAAAKKVVQGKHGGLKLSKQEAEVQKKMQAAKGLPIGKQTKSVPVKPKTQNTAPKDLQEKLNNANVKPNEPPKPVTQPETKPPVTVKPGKFEYKDKDGNSKWKDEAYAKERVDAAIKAMPQSSAEALAKYGSESHQQWNKAENSEKKSVEALTSYSGSQNYPLFGKESIGKSNKMLIDGTTSYIDKCATNEDRVVRSGHGHKTINGMFGIKSENMTLQQLEKALVGKVGQHGGFMECGTAKGTGFHGTYNLEIYAPSGTRMAYIGPHSSFGNGYECETVIQRGTSFRCVGVEAGSGSTGKGWGGEVTIRLEVVGQIPEGCKVGDGKDGYTVKDGSHWESYPNHKNGTPFF